MRPVAAIAGLSLRSRLLGATALLVVTSLAVAVLSFERAAETIVREVIREHLFSRSAELLAAVSRHQLDHVARVCAWAEAQAMRQTLQAADPSPAENYLRRAVHDDADAFVIAGLLDRRSQVVVAVEPGGPGALLGNLVPQATGRSVGGALKEPSAQALASALGLEDPRRIDPTGSGLTRGLVVSCPVVDPGGDRQGEVFGIISTAGTSRLITSLAGSPASAYLPVVFDETGALAGGAGARPATLAGLRRADAAARAWGGPQLGSFEAEGAPVLAVVARGSPSGWAAAVVAREDQALAPLRRLRRTLLMIAALVVILAFAGATAIAARLAEPIARLVERTRVLKRGVLDAGTRKARGAELEELTRALEEMIAEISGHRRRDELAAFLVHDLKAPLTALLLGARAIREENKLAEAGSQWANEMVGSAETMLGMVSDLLDVGCSEEGQLVPKKTEFDVLELLEQVRSEGAPRCLEKDQTILIAGQASQLARADRELLRRVLCNLVDNSFKYTPQGGKIRLESQPVAAGWLELRVRDEGPGIPAELRARIFDKYFRLERDASTHGRTSRGLGLVFCRAAIEAHGGRIWVEADHPGGSAFCLRIPSLL